MTGWRGDEDTQPVCKNVMAYQGTQAKEDNTLNMQSWAGGLRKAGFGVLAVSALFLVIGCSDQRSSEIAPQSADMECGGLLSRADIEEAFDGVLTVQSTTVAAMGGDIAGCLIQIEEGINNRLNLTVADQETFLTRKEAQMRASGGRQDTLDVGAEGYVFDGVYAIALLEDGRSVSLGISPKVVSEENILTPEQGAEGLGILTDRIVSRLKAQPGGQ